MTEAYRISSFQMDMERFPSRLGDPITGSLHRSPFDMAEAAQRVMTGSIAYNGLSEQIEAARYGVTCMSAVDKILRQQQAEIEALGGVTGIHRRATAAHSLFEAAGGFDVISRRHEALASSFTTDSSVSFLDRYLADHGTTASSAVERAMRDLAGAGSFSSLMARRMESNADNFTAMVNGAIDWRATGMGLSLERRMQSEFPHLFPELRMMAAADVTRAPMGLLAEQVLRTQSEIDRVRQEMLGLRQPWMDARAPYRSVAAYTDAHALMSLVRKAPAESRRVVAAVREKLGDRRSSGPVPIEIVADPILRTNFRAESGFDADLSSLPAAVLVSIFSWLGAKTTKHAAADPDALQQMIGGKIRVIEVRIRRFIEARMQDVFGDRWFVQRVSPHIVDKWRDRRQTDLDNLRKPGRLFDYAGFEDYLEIIERSDNWSAAFKDIFLVKTSILEVLRRLSLIRNPSAHVRVLTIEDMIDLAVEGRRVDKWLERAGH